MHAIQRQLGPGGMTKQWGVSDGLCMVTYLLTVLVELLADENNKDKNAKLKGKETSVACSCRQLLRNTDARQI
jgi:hypothetical protein